jgi:hypothetical protein
MLAVKKLSLYSLFIFTIVNSAHSIADGVGFTIGMHGIAVDYQKAVSEKLSVRFMLSDNPISADIKEEGIEYEAEYDRTNLGVLVYYYPMEGTFHLTGGLHMFDHNLKLKATAKNGQYEIGDNTYTSNNLNLKAQVAFAKAAPYLGLGWGNTIADTGFSGNIDLGLLYVGTPSVSYKASGTVSNGGPALNVAINPQFQSDLEKERADLEDELSNFNIMPVIQFGLTYKF